MADQSFLHWPFFEERHRQLAAELDAWAGEHIPTLVANEHEDLDGTCIGIVRALGAAGFTGYAVPASGGGLLEKLDVRSLCIVREPWAATPPWRTLPSPCRVWAVVRFPCSALRNSRRATCARWRRVKSCLHLP